jgi:hypothetical protein
MHDALVAKELLVASFAWCFQGFSLQEGAMAQNCDVCMVFPW